MQAGQNPHDPLTLLNSHLGFGAMAGVNPFAELGLNPNDPNMFQTMINSPQFMQQMSSLLSNPDIVDQIIASNPQLASMGPQVRAAFQSPQFRELMSNPERLQQMMQLTAALRQSGFNPDPLGGSALFPPSFSAPNNPSLTTTTTTPSAQPQVPQTPGSPGTTSTATGGTTTGSTQPQPFNLFAAAAAGARGSPASGAGAGAGQQQQPLSPFDPALMQQLMTMNSLGGYGGLGGLGSLGELSGAPAVRAADSRPPEERFETQLRQLQEMGFTNAAQNVRALLATGGNVQMAIEYIFGGGGLS
jgi:ubiquilin